MRIAALSLLVLLAACSGTVPVRMTFPEAPPVLLEPVPPLTPLNRSANPQLSDLLENANTNYSKYHQISARLTAWQEWYSTQRQIFEEVK